MLECWALLWMAVDLVVAPLSRSLWFVCLGVPSDLACPRRPSSAPFRCLTVGGQIVRVDFVPVTLEGWGSADPWP